MERCQHDALARHSFQKFPTVADGMSKSATVLLLALALQIDVVTCQQHAPLGREGVMDGFQTGDYSHAS